MNIANITDLIIPIKHPELTRIYPSSHGLTDTKSFAQRLMEQAKESLSSQKNEFTVYLDGDSYRCRRIPTINGDSLSVRRHEKQLRNLGDLGIPMPILQGLISPKLNEGGLIIVAGSPGQGKSTTCAAITIERLKLFGGVCLSIEDPVERVLQGEHGNGYCMQTEVTDETSYQEAIRGALRSYPSGVPAILYVGEIRDAFAASQLLTAAIDGRLVLTTLHASDVPSAVSRLKTLAQSRLGEEQTNHLLAAGLRWVIHQRLKNGKLSVRSLFNNEQAAQIIQNGNIHLLSSEIERQQRLIELGHSIS